MDRLKVIGPYKGWTGYDHYTRAFVREFVRVGIRVELVHLARWSAELPPEQRDGPFFDQLIAPVDAYAVLHFAMPIHAQPEWGKCNVNYTMFEASGIPQDWVLQAMPHRAIVVPTQSSRLAWINSGVPQERVYISPLGVDTHFFGQKADPLSLIDANNQRPASSYHIRFLNIAELRPRKNHLALLRCWLRATTPDDDAILILKIASLHSQYFETFRTDCLAMLAKHRLSFESSAPVVFITEIYTDEQIRALYHTATHYISMSKGEGWDMVMMEAAVSGLQLVAPRHSAYTRYLTDEDTEFIPAQLRPVTFEGETGKEDYLWFKGLSWWEPDEDAAVEIIRRVIRGEGLSKPSPRDRILNEYTWENAARCLIEIINELG